MPGVDDRALEGADHLADGVGVGAEHEPCFKLKSRGPHGDSIYNFPARITSRAVLSIAARDIFLRVLTRFPRFA